MTAEHRRYQAFVSSTFTDLVEERQKVADALLRSDIFPAGMELFPAGNTRSWDRITREIDASDFYVLIIGGRYGSLAEDGLSYTEKEFHYAVSQGKFVLAFVHGEPDSLPVRRSELDPARREQLVRFRDEVRSRYQCNSWRSGDDLANAVLVSITKAIPDSGALGWVRDDGRRVAPAPSSAWTTTLHSETTTLAPAGFVRTVEQRIAAAQPGLEIVMRRCAGDGGSRFLEHRVRTPGMTLLQPSIEAAGWTRAFIHLGRQLTVDEEIDLAVDELYAQEGPWTARNGFSYFASAPLARLQQRVEFPDEMTPTRAFQRVYLGDSDFGQVVYSRELPIVDGAVTADPPQPEVGRTYAIDLEWDAAALARINDARDRAFAEA